MTAAGVRAVARQEFRLRVRAGRWRRVLVLWTAVLLAFTLLLTAAVRDLDLSEPGAVVYGGLTLLVLSLALLVVPSLAAQSVNGARERGTLAVLQVTRLSAAEIVVGTFLAAWGTALVFLALSLPLAAYAVTLGGVPLLQVLAVTTVLALLLGSVTAISLWLSAVLTRTTTSAVLAYLVVFGLTVGTPVVFGLATALTVERVQTCPPGAVDCFTQERARTDRTWWLLAPNPFVVLADASPQRDLRDDGGAGLDPLGSLGRVLRGVRSGPEDLSAPEPLWPTGLAVHAGLAAGALLSATRRVRAPSRVLPRGQRIA